MIRPVVVAFNILQHFAERDRCRDEKQIRCDDDHDDGKKEYR